MRTPTDMPQRRRISRGRLALIVTAAVVFVLFMSLRGLAGFWTDWMWFDSLGLSSVFTGVLGAKIALGAIFTAAFFVMVLINLVIYLSAITKRLAVAPRPFAWSFRLFLRFLPDWECRATGTSGFFSVMAEASA